MAERSSATMLSSIRSQKSTCTCPIQKRKRKTKMTSKMAIKTKKMQKKHTTRSEKKVKIVRRLEKLEPRNDGKESCTNLQVQMVKDGVIFAKLRNRNK